MASINPLQRFESSIQKHASTLHDSPRSTPPKPFTSPAFDGGMNVRPGPAFSMNAGSEHFSLGLEKVIGSKQQVVEMNLRLDMDFQAAGQEGSIQRQIFIQDLKQDLSDASGMGTSDFNILKVSPGSVVVGMNAPEKAAQEIQRQSLDPNSRLRSGKVTRFTDEITLPRGMQHRGEEMNQNNDNPLAAAPKQLHALALPALALEKRLYSSSTSVQDFRPISVHSTAPSPSGSPTTFRDMDASTVDKQRVLADVSDTSPQSVTGPSVTRAASHWKRARQIVSVTSAFQIPNTKSAAALIKRQPFTAPVYPSDDEFALVPELGLCLVLKRPAYFLYDVGLQVTPTAPYCVTKAFLLDTRGIDVSPRVKMGDTLVAIDGNPTNDLRSINSILRGPEGSTLLLTFAADHGQTPAGGRLQTEFSMKCIRHLRTPLSLQSAAGYVLRDEITMPDLVVDRSVVKMLEDMRSMLIDERGNRKDLMLRKGDGSGSMGFQYASSSAFASSSSFAPGGQGEDSFYRIDSMIAGGPAHICGDLRRGDTILSVDNIPVTSETLDACFTVDKCIGSCASLVIQRDSTQYEVLLVRSSTNHLRNMQFLFGYLDTLEKAIERKGEDGQDILVHFHKLLAHIIELERKRSQGEMEVAAHLASVQARLVAKINGIESMLRPGSSLDSRRRPLPKEVDVTDSRRGCLALPNSADVTVKLGLDFKQAGEPDSEQRSAFVNTLQADLARATGLKPDAFLVKSLLPGSVLVDLRIFVYPSSGKNPNSVVDDLKRQAADPKSLLCAGVVSRFVEDIGPCKTLELPPASRPASRLQSLNASGDKVTLDVNKPVNGVSLDGTHTLMRQLADSTEQLQSMKLSISANENTIKSLHDKLDDRWKQLRESQTNLSDTEEELANLQQHDDMMTRLVEELKAKLSNSQTQPDLLLEELSEIISNAPLRLSRSSITLDNRASPMIKMEEELRSVQEELRSAQDHDDFMTRMVAELQNKLREKVPDLSHTNKREASPKRRAYTHNFGMHSENIGQHSASSRDFAQHYYEQKVEKLQEAEMTNFFNPQENDKIRKEQAEHDIECNRVKDRLVLLEELFQELQTRNGELESHVQMLNEQLQQRDVKLQTVSNVNSNSGGDELATLRDENLQLRGKNAQLKDDMVYLQHLVPENNRLKDQLAQLQQVQTINGALEHEMKLLHAQLRLVTEEKSKMKETETTQENLVRKLQVNHDDLSSQVSKFDQEMKEARKQIADLHKENVELKSDLAVTVDRARELENSSLQAGLSDMSLQATLAAVQAELSTMRSQVIPDLSNLNSGLEEEVQILNKKLEFATAINLQLQENHSTMLRRNSELEEALSCTKARAVELEDAQDLQADVCEQQQFYAKMASELNCQVRDAENEIADLKLQLTEMAGLKASLTESENKAKNFEIESQEWRQTFEIESQEWRQTRHDLEQKLVQTERLIKENQKLVASERVIKENSSLRAKVQSLEAELGQAQQDLRDAFKDIREVERQRDSLQRDVQRTSELVNLRSVPAIANPVMDPPGGTFVGRVIVTISGHMPGCSVVGTTNGSEPSANNSTLSGPSPYKLTLSQSAQLKVMLVSPDGRYSAVASQNYVLQHRSEKSSPQCTAETINSCGVGIIFENIGGGMTAVQAAVKDFVPGGAAERNGRIAKGDIVLSIDGRSTSGLDAQDLQNLVKGQPGTQVSLIVESSAERDGETQQRQYILLTRAPNAGILKTL